MKNVYNKYNCRCTPRHIYHTLITLLSVLFDLLYEELIWWPFKVKRMIYHMGNIQQTRHLLKIQYQRIKIIMVYMLI